jgi:endonuclease G
MGMLRFLKARWGAILPLILLLGLTGCTQASISIVVQSANPNLALGNPSQASNRDPNNYLIERPQYVLSYNRSRNIANWVSWQLAPDWLGSLPRGNFAPDTSLPAGWPEITPADYTGSGFDRGHLVPAADRNATPEDSAAVFLMTNIFPQAPDNNRGPWEKLERYCRELAKNSNQLYIIAGVSGQGGVGTRGARETIGRSKKITVPAKVWKVVVVNEGFGGASLRGDSRVIAVIMPNQQGIENQDWRDFRTSVKEIETLTGYDLLSNLPPELQAELETKVDDR